MKKLLGKFFFCFSHVPKPVGMGRLWQAYLQVSDKSAYRQKIGRKVIGGSNN